MGRDQEPPKNEKIKGNYDKILFIDLKKKLGTLECFYMLSGLQIRTLLRRNYRYLNTDTLDFAVCRIAIKTLDDEFMEKESEQVNFVSLVIDSLKK